MINGNGKSLLFYTWEIPDEGKIGLIRKKNEEKTVLALFYPYETIPIYVEVKEKFVPSRFKETMQKWERSRTEDGHFVLRNVDPSALTFGLKYGISNTLLYANDYGMSIGTERTKDTIPAPVLTNGNYFNNNYQGGRGTRYNVITALD